MKAHVRAPRPTEKTVPTAPEPAYTAAPSLDGEMISPAKLLDLQRMIGNRAVQQWVHRQRIQRVEGTDTPVGPPSTASKVPLQEQYAAIEQEYAAAIPKVKELVELYMVELKTALDQGDERTFNLYAKLIRRKFSATPTFGGDRAALEKDSNLFKREDAEKDLKTLEERLSRVPTLKDANLLPLFRRYVDALEAYDAGRAETILITILNVLKQYKAFKVDRDVFFRDDLTAQELAAIGSKAKMKGTLWSKLEKYLPIEMARSEEAISLESSLGGALFDGLEFGRHYPDARGIMGPQWRLISESYVQRVRGIIHVRLLKGIHPSSVFTTTEVPAIREMMAAPRKNGRYKIEGVVIHLYDADSTGKNLRETEQRFVTNPSDLPTPEDIKRDAENPNAPTPHIPRIGSDQQSLDAFKTLQSAVWKEEVRRTRELIESHTKKTLGTDFVPPAWDKEYLDEKVVQANFSKEQENAILSLRQARQAVKAGTLPPDVLEKQLQAYIDRFVTPLELASEANESAPPTESLNPSAVVEPLEEE